MFYVTMALAILKTQKFSGCKFDIMEQPWSDREKKVLKVLLKGLFSSLVSLPPWTAKSERAFGIIVLFPT